MKYIEKLRITRGYYEIGFAENIDEAIKICEKYCDKNNISYELKKQFSDTEVTVLIFQYSTLYFETFVVTSKFELN